MGWRLETQPDRGAECHVTEPLSTALPGSSGRTDPTNRGRNRSGARWLGRAARKADAWWPAGASAPYPGTAVGSIEHARAIPGYPGQEFLPTGPQNLCHVTRSA
eukprot:3179086-Rhodomonas_salina.2